MQCKVTCSDLYFQVWELRQGKALRPVKEVDGPPWFPSLDHELQQKLASIGDEQPSPQQEQTNTLPAVTAETQAERAARICDIIVEEK